MKSSVNCKSRNILSKSLLLLCEIWLSKQHQNQILQLLRCICITIFEQSFWLKKKLVSVNSPNNYFTIFIFLFDTCLLFSEAVFYKKVFLEISQNSQENTCANDSFFVKLAGLRSATLLKKGLWQRYFPFPVNFTKFLRTPLFTEHLRWLLLYFVWRFFDFLITPIYKFSTKTSFLGDSFKCESRKAKNLHTRRTNINPKQKNEHWRRNEKGRSSIVYWGCQDNFKSAFFFFFFLRKGFERTKSTKT